MDNIRILWTDDEIDLLKPHIIFLQHKGFEVDTASNGSDAIEKVATQDYDLIFLDEMMPGLTGLETLTEIKKKAPHIPVIMITKSEEENIMDEAIGAQIDDYLIKPVNPKQILLSIKKHVDHDRLVKEKTNMDFQAQFRQLSMHINEGLSFEEWKDVYKTLVSWEMKLAASGDNTMDEIIKMQKNEANEAFSKFISRNYTEWLAPDNTDASPMMSHKLMRQQLVPLLEKNRKVVCMVIDNLRYDQWKTLEPLFAPFFKIQKDDIYYSILPTATQYARNAIFSGLMPSEIDKIYPELWKDDHEEGGKNLHEESMLFSQIRRYTKDKKIIFEKASDIQYMKRLQGRLNELLQHDLITIVVNFVDMLSHARTDMKMIKDLAGDESAYRSLTKSWFSHSPLFDFLQKLSEEDVELILTTDHGSIRVQNPVKIVGDRNTTTNLKYKQGKNLNYDKREVFEILQPQKAFLPKSNISSSYVFSLGNDYFVYPNNYNQYVKMYKDTFQHGGVSLEEMLIPVIHMSSRSY